LEQGQPRQGADIKQPLITEGARYARNTPAQMIANT